MNTDAQIQKFPELLIPVGDWEKLEVAVAYGADAVYLAGQDYSLRSRAGNFSKKELKEARHLTSKAGVKMYMTINNFFHDEDIDSLQDYLPFLIEINPDAIIASDLGVLQLLREETNIPLHLSTQASALNVESGLFWKKRGVSRLILGREASIRHGGEIARTTDLEVEMFIHGSMCMAYSGHCTISNFTAGRDSNRGGCAQSCRFQYNLGQSKEDKTRASYFMNSKDLNGVHLIQDFVNEGIASLKIEGRMRSALFVATVTRAYARVLKEIKNEGQCSLKTLQWAQAELNKFSHRAYTEASLLSPAGLDSVDDRDSNLEANAKVAIKGVVIDQSKDFLFIQLRNPWQANEMVELIGPDFFQWQGQISLHNLKKEPIPKARQDSIICIPNIAGASIGSFVRTYSA